MEYSSLSGEVCCRPHSRWRPLLSCAAVYRPTQLSDITPLRWRCCWHCACADSSSCGNLVSTHVQRPVDRETLRSSDASWWAARQLLSHCPPATAGNGTWVRLLQALPWRTGARYLFALPRKERRGGTDEASEQSHASFPKGTGAPIPCRSARTKHRWSSQQMNPSESNSNMIAVHRTILPSRQVPRIHLGLCL